MQVCTIIETIKDGRMHRTCSNCGTDVTMETSWFRYRYCPWCGKRVVRPGEDAEMLIEKESCAENA